MAATASCSSAPIALPERTISARSWRCFWMITAVFWGATVCLGILFYCGVVDFYFSTILSLYGTSIWLNAALLPFYTCRASPSSSLSSSSSSSQSTSEARSHEVIALWFIIYTMTNALWEVPWLLSSPFIFSNLSTREDLFHQTPWMRESPPHMFYWVMSSFGSCDLRTINHNETFYTLELFAFLNIALALLFWRLNAARSPLRYAVPLLSSGVPVAATVIFSLSEVVNNFANMPGGAADTLLALLWTQYQYVAYPLLCCYLSFPLFVHDVRVVARQKGKQS